MRVVAHVVVVLLQYGSEEFVFCVMDRLDNEAVVAREVEKGAGFARRSELGEDVLRSERKQVVGRVKIEVILAQDAEDPRGVVLELEVVLGRRCQLVSDAVGHVS